MVDVVVTSDFEAWYDGLAMEEQESVALSVSRLGDYGVSLGHPHCSAINGATFAMRELRIQHQGRPFRVFYAFDPKRQAVLIVGGDKTGRDRFYEEMIPVAERIWKEYLAETA